LAALATLAAFVTLPAPAAVADTTTDTYIVQLKAGVSADKVTGKIMGTSAKVIHKVFQGGIVKLTAAQAQALSTNPDVKSVHKDAVVKASGTETSAPWDLDVLDSTTGALDTTYSYPNNGSNVTVYVVDSGIMRSHTEFSGVTVAPGINFVENVDPSTTSTCAAGKTADTTVNPANTNDENGHGTEVSSLIAGATWGASKGVTIVPVRVLNCDGVGTESDIISAADWIASNRTGAAAANMSFGLNLLTNPGFKTDTSLETAIQALITAGITVVAAAGNDSIDACNEVPARMPAAITVASMNKQRQESTFSDYGPCVDLYAPGEYDYIASIKSIYSQTQGSGTSFSAPLVTAAAAQVLHDHPTWTPAQVSAEITSRATAGLVVSPRVPNTTPNLLLNVTGHFTGTDPSITDAVYAGETATATLHWVPTPATVSYQWYRSGAAIPGATSATYASTSDDLNLPITVTATASDSGFVPITGTSPAWVPQLGLPMKPVVPTLTGTPAVSYTLTGDPGTAPWDPVDVTLSYKWRRDGVDIPGATALTYAPVAADVGHTLTFKVTGSKPGYASASGESLPTAAIQGGTSELAYEAFVKASYQDFLSRQPNPDELTAQSTALSTGAISRADFLTSMSRSDEWLSAIVTKMYQDTLQRDPDPTGLAGWVTALRTNQWTVAQVASFFYASNEYYTDHAGNSDSTWVTLLYQKLLNRSPDPLGLAQWVAQTRTNGRSWVASNFYQSDESRMKRVQSLYQTLLSRDPDPVGWAWWKGTILTTGDLVLATQIAGSDEYWNKAHVRY
jgi:subtilisin family serine protease